VTAFDYAVLGVLGASLLLGLWRGVVSEVLALAAWVVGFLVARAYAGEVSVLYRQWLADPTLRYAAGFATVVIGVLVVFGIGRLVLSLMLRAVGLGLIDRLLGAAFGAVRGVVIAMVAVLLGGMTAWPKESWWRDAVLAPPLETAVIAMKPWLPPDVAKRIRFR
jgi:membrane protein required for colicin V production